MFWLNLPGRHSEKLKENKIHSQCNNSIKMHRSDSGKHSFACKSHIKLYSHWFPEFMEAPHHFIELSCILNDNFKGPLGRWKGTGKPTDLFALMYIMALKQSFKRKNKNYHEQLVAKPEISDSNSALQVLKSTYAASYTIRWA